jgi:hypothetical protein
VCRVRRGVPCPGSVDTPPRRHHHHHKNRGGVRIYRVGPRVSPSQQPPPQSACARWSRASAAAAAASAARGSRASAGRAGGAAPERGADTAAGDGEDPGSQPRGPAQRAHTEVRAQWPGLAAAPRRLGEARGAGAGCSRGRGAIAPLRHGWPCRLSPMARAASAAASAARAAARAAAARAAAAAAAAAPKSMAVVQRRLGADRAVGRRREEGGGGVRPGLLSSAPRRGQQEGSAGGVSGRQQGRVSHAAVRPKRRGQ